MKRLLILVLLLPCFSFGQNLVPNPSFEAYDTCPNNQDQFHYLQNWVKHTIYSPDYFNACAPNGNSFSVPYNWGGYQQAATGDGYAGIYTFEATPPYDIREYIGCQLISPLTIGTKYFISFKTSLAIDNQYVFTHATSNFGVLFSNTQRNFSIPPNKSHINNPSFITDTSTWVTVGGSFIADSTYQHVIIGNFYDDASTDTMLVSDTAYYPYVAAYYFVDDVCVSTDSTLCDVAAITIPVPRMPNLLIYPNPTTGKFTLQGATAEIQIFDLFGRLVLRTNKAEIDMSSYPAGLYIWQVGEARGKLVLE